MSTSLADFADDTAFERYVLDKATPLMPRSESAAVVELGDGSTSVAVGPPPITVHVSASDSAESIATEVSTDDLRPLFFGAGWKVLDLLIELGLERMNVPHDRRNDYSIKFKANEARSNSVQAIAPFVPRLGLWERICKIYSSTEELRHSLVHRRLIVDPLTGDIRGARRPGGTVPQLLTASEQSAFCRVAAGAAQVVLAGRLTTREGSQLRWELDHLTVHHGQPALGASPVRGHIPLVVVRPSVGPSDQATLDFSGIQERARAAVGGVSHFDIEIRLPDGRALRGPLEDAPHEVLTFSASSPPGWLNWM